MTRALSLLAFTAACTAADPLADPTPGPLEVGPTAAAPGACAIQASREAGDSAYTLRYAATGRLLEVGYDFEADGVDDLVAEVVREDGHVVRVTERWLDGTSATTTTWTWDDQGRPVAQETGYGDLFGGRVEVVWDDGGRLLERTVDQDGDGEADEVDRRAYDAGGRLVWRQQELPWCGFVALEETYAYDDADRLVETLAWTDGVERPTRIERRTWDDDGLVELAIDVGGDGTVDQRETWARDEGRVVRHAWDDDGDGRADRQELTSYDALGRVAEIGSDFGADGAVEHLERRAWWGDGEDLRQTDWDWSADGRVDATMTWDRAGNLVAYGADGDGDGVEESWLAFRLEGDCDRVGWDGGWYPARWFGAPEL